MLSAPQPAAIYQRKEYQNPTSTTSVTVDNVYQSSSVNTVLPTTFSNMQ